MEKWYQNQCFCGKRGDCMKVVILAGGYGTRISEESVVRPKPMVEIGGMPVLWHIMKLYSYYGFDDFIICCGYKGYMIKEYFANYYMRYSDLTFDFKNSNEITTHNNVAESWKVTLVDTGIDTMTGGRIKRIKNYVGDEPFLLTYGDGVSNVDIKELLEYHQRNEKMVTITAVQPDVRFGYLDINPSGEVLRFAEKAKEDVGWINAGFMVVEPKVIDYIEGDCTVFEREPLERLVELNQVTAYKHMGFWQCMDTMRDKKLLEELDQGGKAPWKVWEQI